MTVSVSAPITAQGIQLLAARKQLDSVTAYREVGTYRGAAEMCGVTHKTVSRVVQRPRLLSSGPLGAGATRASGRWSS